MTLSPTLNRDTGSAARLRAGRPPGFSYTPEEIKRFSMTRRKYWENDEFTQSRRNQLKALIEQGLTNKAAGAVMGIGKSAVSGMLDRMIKSGIAVNRPVKERKAKPAKKAWEPRSKVPVAPQPRKHIEHPPMTPVPLLERTGCAFPVNDGKPFLFCDNEKHFPTSYCEFHGKLMMRGE